MDPTEKGEGGRRQQLGRVGFRGVVGEGVLASREGEEKTTAEVDRDGTSTDRETEKRGMFTN